MTLTGRTLPILLAILVVVGLVATLLVWGRVRGPRWARRGQHIGLLLVNQIVAVALVCVLANDAGDFFSSWSDLFGNANGTSQEYALHGDAPSSTPALSDVTSTTFSTPSQRTERGELTSATIDGGTSGLDVKVEVYLPPQYFQPAHADVRFPVIEVVDSAPKDDAATATTFLQAIRAGSAKPALLVLVDASGSAWAHACVNTTTGPQTTSFLDADVPLAIPSAYRAQTRGWGVTGVGAGGYCAAKLALTEPNMFWSGAATNAIFSPSESSSGSLPNLNDLLSRLRTLPIPPANLLVLDTASADAAVTAQTATLRSLAQAPMQLSVTTPAPTSTTAATAQALRWLSMHVLPPQS